MRRALELAQQGEGYVEPNPMVGCVIARGAEMVGEGYHRRYGGPHAEVEALVMAGARAAGATMYVTLEPCSHHGKTPPCTDAILRAGLARVVVAQTDPFPQVCGQGITRLRAAGIQVEVGLLKAEAERLNAPYLKLLKEGRPWVIAKWAMTLDGKIASASGESRWISSPRAREIVHRLRGRIDAIIIGRGTAEKDDPLLTARPPGPRTPLRIVLDTQAILPSDSRLVRTAKETPLMVVAGNSAPQTELNRLSEAGCEIFVCPGADATARLNVLLQELGRRRMTNVLVEGGSTLLGALLDARLIDEVHVFISPKLLGGRDALSAIAGQGFATPDAALPLETPQVESIDGDIYVCARVKHEHNISPA